MFGYMLSQGGKQKMKKEKEIINKEEYKKYIIALLPMIENEKELEFLYSYAKQCFDKTTIGEELLHAQND